jgi:hypothetical protein
MNVGDVYFNKKTKVKSMITAIRGDQICFVRTDNSNRKFQLTKAQMTNMVMLTEESPPPLPPQLPTLPEFLRDK